MTRVGVYPGSFNPPTRAHLEIALTAREVHGLVRVDFAVSRVALGKHQPPGPSFEERVEVLRASVAEVDGLDVTVTEAQLVTEIAVGYHVVVMGADKWTQVNDPSWYGHDIDARDAAMAALPDLAIAPRPPHDVPRDVQLPVAADLLEISSTAARAGRVEWMTDAAREHQRRTGAWRAD